MIKTTVDNFILNFQLNRLIADRIADLIKSAFDKLFTLLADVMVNCGHCLNRTRSRTRESKFAVDHFTLVKSKGSVAKDNKTTISELAAFVFVEIKDDFFISERIFYNFHIIFNNLYWRGFRVHEFR